VRHPPEGWRRGHVGGVGRRRAPVDRFEDRFGHRLAPVGVYRRPLPGDGLVARVVTRPVHAPATGRPTAPSGRPSFTFLKIIPAIAVMLGGRQPAHQGGGGIVDQKLLTTWRNTRVIIVGSAVAP
jgi:hypothetical protein